MNVHKNALMTQKGRVALVKRVREDGWRVADAAHSAGISVRTAYKWLARFKDGGEASLFDKSSAPRRSPTRIADDAVESIAVLRRQRLSGVAIAQKLGMARSNANSVLLCARARPPLVWGWSPPFSPTAKSLACDLADRPTTPSKD
jgi:hypothetical protein